MSGGWRATRQRRLLCSSESAVVARRRPSPGSSGRTGHASVVAARVWQLSSLRRASLSRRGSACPL
eukprot:14725780-Alexandrium_andersonii.AAC.1